MTLIVVSRHIGNGSSLGLLNLLFNRSKCFLTLLISTPFSFEFVDAVDEFLHREGGHRVLWLVATVSVVVCRRR